MINLKWSEISCVIFDLDGTLYDQSKMCRRMFIKLLSHYFIRPGQWKDLVILWKFRRNRENMRFDLVTDLDKIQYTQVSQALDVSYGRVVELVEKWILTKPLEYLKECRFVGVKEFFQNLRAHGKLIGIFSEYPVADKLSALELFADAYVCATDKEVDRFKPDPKGLKLILTKLEKSPTDCLYIGNREKLDGVCAKSLSMEYLIKKQNKALADNSFFSYEELNLNPDKLTPVPLL